ncbi:MAG: hypothetical protein FWC14_04855 [Candidatus Bathyarchaeota archaeon]|uniref:hypothetical protein n=1 Tax=Candidatus Bathycorpusculum sp. TaxID=2994959 RepID=UPI00281B867D|nr:hypothetical protein [Candidatus Termiticorpusculum sp.]MCL2292354.1 hypothetical protein [Candidatus Termiticorpusculum sp.]
MAHTLRLLIKIPVPAVGVHRVQDFRRNSFLQTAARAKVPTTAAYVVETVLSLSGVLYFFLKNKGRAHLHIPTECQTAKPYKTYGFDDNLDTQKRRNP